MRALREAVGDRTLLEVAVAGLASAIIVGWAIVRALHAHQVSCTCGWQYQSWSRRRALHALKLHAWDIHGAAMEPPQGTTRVGQLLAMMSQAAGRAALYKVATETMATMPNSDLDQLLLIGTVTLAIAQGQLDARKEGRNR